MSRSTSARSGTWAFSVAVVAILLLSGWAALGTGRSAASPSVVPLRTAPASGTGLHAAASSPWTYPTTTQQEPNYTGGNYILAETSDVEHLNLYQLSDLYSQVLSQEVYDSLNALAPNQSFIPWAASGWSEAAAPAGTMTFDPLTGSMQPVRFIYTVNIQPGIQWTDWTSSTASSTYLYSNHTSFSLWNSTTSSVQSFSYTYSWPSVTMSTEQLQSADVILDWEILVSSADFSANFANIVNVVPKTNLTVQFYLSAQSATFITSTLGTPIIPYHLWSKHDWADSNTAGWNYTGSGYPNGYDSWDVGYDPSTGTASGLVGTGPYMVTNSYSQPQGKWVPGQYWTVYVNPHYFAQYVPALRQWSPKLAQITVNLYLSISAAVAAEQRGEVDTQLEGNGVPSTFLPTVETIPDTTIFYQPTGNFGYIALNPASTDAPLNVTAFRQALNYATDKAYLAAVFDAGFENLGQPTVPVADSTWHNYSTPQYTYSLSTAASLLSGIPGMTKNGQGNLLYYGTPVTISLQITPAAISPTAVEGALLTAQAWSSLGIPTTVTQEAFSTLVSNLIGNAYQALDISITGIQGDPTGAFFDFYNASVGTGTGFYEGPYSSLTINGVPMTGAQVTSLMNNLTNQLNVVTNFTQRLAIAYEIEGIAAEESTIVTLGYPIAILPFSNATFTGLIEDSLGYASFIYWNFLSFHIKSSISVTPPPTIPTQLEVGVVAPKTVYENGQYSNVTVQVRNQYGAPMSGMNVTVGVKPSGQLVNISPDRGVTNAQGQYTWEFQVFPANPLVYTTDYYGSVNITVAATKGPGVSGTVLGGLGWTTMDVTPEPVAYSTSASPTLVSGSAPVPFTITVVNPATGSPISGYSWDLQALTGAVNLTPGASGESVTTMNSFSPIFGFGFQSVVVGSADDYDLTSVSGVTGASGQIVVDLQANSSVNWSAMGSSFTSYLFIGDYAASSTVSGVPPFQQIAEVTSSFDGRFGTGQPVEVPITVAEVAPSVHLSVQVADASIAFDGTTTVTVVATNATTHAPIAGYNVVLTSQNALGANRGVLSNPAGTPVEAYNPNNFFGSSFLPGINLTTDATGTATATFSPELYQPGLVGGIFAGFASMPYTDPYLVPFDEFEIGAMGAFASAEVASTVVNSTSMVNNVAPIPVASAYWGGSSTISGFTVIASGSSSTLYVNSTANGPWGPGFGGVGVNVSASLGTVASPNGTTSSSGSYSTTYSAPTVSVLTMVTLRIIYVVNATTGSKVTAYQTAFIQPVSSTSPPPPGSNSTSSAPPYLYLATIGVLAVLVLLFLVLWVMGRPKKPAASMGSSPGAPAPKPWEGPGASAPTSGGGTSGSTTGGSGSSGSGGGSSPPPPMGSTPPTR